MKFKLTSENNNELNIIDLTIQNRNVLNPSLLKNPEFYDEFTLPSLIARMEEAVNFLLDNIHKKICIVVDSDADGYTSASILYNYLQVNYKVEDLFYIVHSTKRHGITSEVMEFVKENTIELLIVPDAGSNDVELAAELAKMGVDLIVLDHHDIDTPIKDGILVNNQLCENSNKNFTGAGMVYKFIELMDSKNEKKQSTFANDYLDLVAIGQIGDSSDISDPEIRYLVDKGLKNIKNKYLSNAINTDLGFGVDVTPRELSFSVIPVINAVTRVGDIQTRQILFEAMADINTRGTFEVEKRVKNRVTGKFDKVQKVFNIQQMAYDLSKKAKGKQDSEVKKNLPIIEATINKDLPIIVGVLDNIELRGISGLIANKLVNKYEKPALLLNVNDDRTGYTGSGRGHEKTIDSFKEWCNKSNLFKFAKGHDNAFGVEITNDNVEKLSEFAIDNLAQNNEIEYEVDILSDRPSIDDCNLVYLYRGIFGGKVQEPLIGLQNMNVPKRFISNRGSVLNIYSWGVGLVRFNTTEELIEEIQRYPGDEVIFNIVGTYSMNNWGNKLSPQLVIKDIEIVYDVEKNTVVDDEDELIF